MANISVQVKSSLVNSTDLEPFNSYPDYLNSDHWQYTRQQKWQHSPHRCRICGSRHHLIVHHRTYDTLGHENIYLDLVIVCSNCHHLIHFLPDGSKVPLLRRSLVSRENYLYKHYHPLKLPNSWQHYIARTIVFWDRYITGATF